MSTEQKTLIDSGIALAGVTALLYCVSTAHYDGYLSPLLLDPDVLDRNFHQTLYNGFLISFLPAFIFAISYAAYRFLYSYIVLPGLNDWLRESVKGKRRFIKVKNSFIGKRKDSPIEIREKRHTLLVAMYAGLFFVLLLALVYFEKQGKQSAIKILEKLEDKSFDDDELLTVKINNKDYRLFLLACGSRNCAGLDPTTKMVTYFPQNGHSYALQTEHPGQLSVSPKKSGS